MRLLILFLLFAIPLPGLTAKSQPDQGVRFEEMLAQEAATPLPSCDEGLPPESQELCRNLRKADDIAQECELSVYRNEKGQIMREFCVVAHRPADNTFHTILLAMPLFPEKGFQPVVRSKHVPLQIGVIRTAGTSFIKMRFLIFEEHDDGRRLYAMGAKYLWLPSHKSVNTRDLKSVKEQMESIVFLAADDHMDGPGTAEAGYAFIRKLLEPAYEAAHNIPSKSFEGSRVTEHMTLTTLVKAVIIEQTNPKEIKNFRDIAQVLQTDPKKEPAFRRVGNQFFKNGQNAYRYIWSDAKTPAGGTLQFTQKTYHSMYEKIREADLDPDFRRGVQIVHNIGKAAISYLDYTLAHTNIKKCVRDVSRRDRELSRMMAFAEYNGGPEKSEALCRFLVQHSAKTGKAVTFSDFPWQEFDKYWRLSRETFGYLLQYWLVRDLEF